jgi:hypothetical protein
MSQFLHESFSSVGRSLADEGRGLQLKDDGVATFMSPNAQHMHATGYGKHLHPFVARDA